MLALDNKLAQMRAESAQHSIDECAERLFIAQQEGKAIAAKKFFEALEEFVATRDDWEVLKVLISETGKLRDLQIINRAEQLLTTEVVANSPEIAFKGAA